MTRASPFSYLFILLYLPYPPTYLPSYVFHFLFTHELSNLCVSVSASTPLFLRYNLTSPVKDFKKVMFLLPVLGPCPEDSPISGALGERWQAVRCPWDPKQDWEAAMLVANRRMAPQGVVYGITRAIMQKVFGHWNWVTACVERQE